MNCGQGIAVAEVVSVVVAGAAFVVAAATLYYAALRRASLDVDVISALLSPGGWEAPGMPINDWASIHLFWVNSGAAGTFLESVHVTDFAYDGAGPPLWSGFDPSKDAPALSGVGIGSVFEHGDAMNGVAAVYFARSPDVTTPEDVARRVAHLRGVTLTIRWAFRRPKLLRPGRRETETRRVRVVLDGAAYREANVTEWRKTEAAQHLADLAEGKEPELPS